MLGQMLAQTIQQRATNGRLASAKMYLRLKRPVLTMLADKFPHDSTAHRETRRQNFVAALLVPVTADNPLPKVHR